MYQLFGDLITLNLFVWFEYIILYPNLLGNPSMSCLLVCGISNSL